MAFKIVTLADGASCKVRQLGLFELDGKGREVLGPYRYSLLMATGVVMEDTYVIPTDKEDIPIAPDGPQSEFTPEDWEALRAYQTYEAALAWESKRLESYEGYVGDVAGYILEHCVSPEDRNRIVEASDWDAIHAAALVPQLTMEGVAACLRDTFYSEIQG